MSDRANTVCSHMCTFPFKAHYKVIEAVRCLGTGLMHIFKVSIEASIYSHYPVDISTTAFSYSHAMQYHKLLHGTGGVNVCYCMGTM